MANYIPKAYFSPSPDGSTAFNPGVCAVSGDVMLATVDTGAGAVATSYYDAYPVDGHSMSSGTGAYTFPLAYFDITTGAFTGFASPLTASVSSLKVYDVCGTPDGGFLVVGVLATGTVYADALSQAVTKLNGAFIAKLGSDGAWDWIKIPDQAVGTGNGSGALCVDANQSTGDFWVGGIIWLAAETVGWDSVVLGNAAGVGSPQGWICQFDSSGTAIQGNWTYATDAGYGASIGLPGSYDKKMNVLALSTGGAAWTFMFKTSGTGNYLKFNGTANKISAELNYDEHAFVAFDSSAGLIYCNESYFLNGDWMTMAWSQVLFETANGDIIYGGTTTSQGVLGDRYYMCRLGGYYGSNWGTTAKSYTTTNHGIGYAQIWLVRCSIAGSGIFALSQTTDVGAAGVMAVAEDSDGKIHVAVSRGYGDLTLYNSIPSKDAAANVNGFDVIVGVIDANVWATGEKTTTLHSGAFRCTNAVVANGQMIFFGNSNAEYYNPTEAKVIAVTSAAGGTSAVSWSGYPFANRLVSFAYDVEAGDWVTPNSYHPDVIISSTNLSGAVANIQDSPLEPDANNLAGSGAIALYVSFEDPPAGTLSTDSGSQTIRILTS